VNRSLNESRQGDETRDEGRSCMEPAAISALCWVSTSAMMEIGIALLQLLAN
jgi:hypothetical protein